MSEPLTFEGKRFLSSAEAAKVVGYSPDYIGQLCRGGKLVSKRVGKSWFVEESSMRSYKALDLNHTPKKAERLNSRPQRSSNPAKSEHAPPRKSPELESKSEKVPTSLRESVCADLHEALKPAPMSLPPSLSERFEFRHRSEHEFFERLSSKAVSCFSCELLQKVATCALSASLVFGSYEGAKTEVARKASETILSAVAAFAKGTSELTLQFIDDPRKTLLPVGAAVSSFVNLAEELSNSVFARGADSLLGSVRALEAAPTTAREKLVDAYHAGRSGLDRRALQVAAVGSATIERSKGSGIFLYVRSLARKTYALLHPIFEKGETVLATQAPSASSTPLPEEP